MKSVETKAGIEAFFASRRADIGGLGARFALKEGAAAGLPPQ
ncbi:hypothetical protein [Jiella marina]|nr:hypothetical protein [Jiella sp. LLJ827]